MGAAVEGQPGAEAAARWRGYARPARGWIRQPSRGPSRPHPTRPHLRASDPPLTPNPQPPPPPPPAPDAIIGDVCSSASLAATSVANRYKIPMVSPASTSTALSTPDDFFFRCAAAGSSHLAAGSPRPAAGASRPGAPPGGRAGSERAAAGARGAREPGAAPQSPPLLLPNPPLTPGPPQPPPPPLTPPPPKQDRPQRQVPGPVCRRAHGRAGHQKGGRGLFGRLLRTVPRLLLHRLLHQGRRQGRARRDAARQLQHQRDAGRDQEGAARRRVPGHERGRLRGRCAAWGGDGAGRAAGASLLAAPAPPLHPSLHSPPLPAPPSIHRPLPPSPRPPQPSSRPSRPPASRPPSSSETP
jgi:hypothetical protein